MRIILKSRIDLLKILFYRDFKAMYIHNMLGLVWVILNPLFTVIMYSFVFSVILKVRGQGYDEKYSYAVFLLAGMIPYLAISEVIQSAVYCLQQKKDLMIKVVFPAEILPINSVVLSVVGEMITLFMILCLAFYEDGVYQMMWFLLPIIIFLRLMFSMAIAWWISILSVFAPDIKQVINAILPAWMFLTPILYAKEQAPEYFQTLQYFNPLYYIVEAYRAVILEANWPETSLWITFTVLLILNLVGYLFFKSLINRAKDFL